MMAEGGYEVIEGTTNQYAAGSASGCIVCTCEAALSLLRGGVKALGAPEVDRIICAGAAYTNSTHPFVDDVLSHVQRYRDSLTKVHTFSSELGAMNNVLTAMEREADAPGRPCDAFASIMIARAEAVMLGMFRTDRRHPWTFVLFDSHPHSERRNAAFLLFPTKKSCVTYLEKVRYPAAKPIDGGLMLSEVELVAVRLHENAAEQPPRLCFRELEAILQLRECQQRVRELERRNASLEELRSKSAGRLAQENDELRATVMSLEDALKSEKELTEMLRSDIIALYDQRE